MDSRTPKPEVLELPIKVVRRRQRKEDPLLEAVTLQRTINHLQGFALVPRGGVYRFKSHEEADEWMMRRMTATQTCLKPKP